jgi:hypothetical protein
LSKGEEGDQKKRVEAAEEAEKPSTTELRERIARYALV